MEFYEKRYRLIVFDGYNELVCHKVIARDLQCFLENETAHLFKGRLQLDKSGDDIAVAVKGNLIGMITAQLFSKLLSQTSQPVA